MFRSGFAKFGLVFSFNETGVRAFSMFFFKMGYILEEELKRIITCCCDTVEVEIDEDESGNS